METKRPRTKTSTIWPCHQGPETLHPHPEETYRLQGDIGKGDARVATSEIAYGER